jgi:hypothetical protein
VEPLGHLPGPRASELALVAEDVEEGVERSNAGKVGVVKQALASGKRWLPATWSSWQWLCTMRSTRGSRSRRRRSPSDGSIINVSSAPRTSREFPSGYLPPPSWASKDALEKPALFAPGEISTGDFESHPAFTPDGRELYFVKSDPVFSSWTIVVSRFEAGRWTTPTVAPFSGAVQ